MIDAKYLHCWGMSDAACECGTISSNEQGLEKLPFIHAWSRYGYNCTHLLTSVPTFVLALSFSRSWSADTSWAPRGQVRNFATDRFCRMCRALRWPLCVRDKMASNTWSIEISWNQERSLLETSTIFRRIYSLVRSGSWFSRRRTLCGLREENFGSHWRLEGRWDHPFSPEGWRWAWRHDVDLLEFWRTSSILQVFLQVILGRFVWPTVGIVCQLSHTLLNMKDTYVRRCAQAL